MDSDPGPARTLTVAERDVMHITDEIPYFMYLYELFRDLPVRREEWIRGLFCDTGEEKVSPMIAEAVLRYSGKLALADHSLFPELYNILAAAKFVAGDDYAIEVYEKAVSYPPNKDSPPQCQFGKVLDFNFEPLSKYRSLILRSRHLIEKKSPVDWVLEESLKIKRFQWYSRWTRTQESYQAEREFMSYMTPRFTACEPSEEERISREYVCGFGDGFDIRETIRMQHTGKIYISEIKPVNTAAYVLDYRNWPPGSQTKETGFYDHVFMDKYYPWIGLTKSSGHHFRSGVMVAFNRLALSPTQIFAGIDTGRPLSSCVDIALRHTRKVFVWTDSPEELVIPAEASRQVRVMPRSVVPAPVYSLMQEFDIIGNRYEDRPGD